MYSVRWPPEAVHGVMGLGMFASWRPMLRDRHTAVETKPHVTTP